MQHLLFSGFCSTVIRKTVGSHLQCCEHGGWFSSTKQSLSSRNCFFPHLDWSSEEADPSQVNIFLGCMELIPFYPFSCLKESKWERLVQKLGYSGGLLSVPGKWISRCSIPLEMFVIVWLPDACHNPISPGFEPASINGGRYYYPCKEAELICCQRWGANSSLLLIPCPCPH